MTEEIKFTEDEMKQIDDLQQSYANSQNALGQISVSRIRLEQQLTELDSAEDTIRTTFTDTQIKEKQFVESINKKYGDGNLDLSSGVFTPNSQEKTDKTS
jgi:septal ring factor EnvC (AmiA/AmiB activator)